MAFEKKRPFIVLVALFLSLTPLTNLAPTADGAGDHHRGPTDIGDGGAWWDDFTDTSKMRTSSGVNVTAGNVSLTLQRGRGGLEEYEFFPTVMVFDNNDLKFYRPNANRTDYLPLEMVDVFRSTTARFCDLDLDGDMDMLLQQGLAYPEPPKIVICWADGPENWDLEHETTLEVTGFRQFDLGDFNGDGWPDIAFCARDTPNDGSGIFLNKGHGRFGTEPDILLPESNSIWMAAGDLNSDGFDDILLTDISMDDRRIRCYFGGPDGPDTTPDIEIEEDVQISGIQVLDIDMDGNLDVMVGGMLRFYMGGPGGPDNVTDLEFSNQVGGPVIGDVNNDGHFDILSNSGGVIKIFNGSDQGWNESTYQEITGPGLGGAMTVLDIDKDGFDDILLANETKFKVIFGKAGWPTAPSISLNLSSVGTPGSITAVVRRSTSKVMSGTFTTEAITLPAGKRWDILDLDGAMPSDTSVSITLLNGTLQPIEGFSGLTDWNIDISGLSHERTLHVMVQLVSRFGDATAVLDRLLVSWMGEMEWREQFYGHAKIVSLEALEVRGDELRRPVGTSGPGSGAYLSKTVGPDDAETAGTFHTLRCTARIGADQSATLRLLDAVSLDVLAERSLEDGPNEWFLEGLFRLRYHPQIQVQVLAGGLDLPGELAIDDIWLNWTERRHLPPRIVGWGMSAPSVHRTETVDMWFNVTDEYDLSDVLDLQVEHRREGEVDWYNGMLGAMTYLGGLWTCTVSPAIDTPTGVYRFRVNVTDTEGNHTGPVELPLTLEVRSHLPGPPLSPVATAADTRVDLEWEGPLDPGAGDILGFHLYRGGSETSLELLTTIDATVTSFSDINVTNGETYHYAVLARNALGEGPLSIIVNATPQGLPDAPSGLRLVAGNGTVTLSWDPPSDDGGSEVLSYTIYRGESELTLVQLIQLAGTTYTDTGLTKGQTYFYAVAAENGIGLGPRAPALSATPKGLPGAPRVLDPRVGDGNVTLTWLAPLDTGGTAVTAYRVYRGDGPDTLALLIELGPEESSFVDDVVTAGSTYHYGVTAVNSIGAGPRGRIVQVLALSLPGAPLGLVAKAGEVAVVLSWEPPVSDGGSTITDYIVLRGTSEGDLIEVARVGSEMRFRDSDLQRGTTYHYSIVATNVLGQGKGSEVITSALKVKAQAEPPVEPEYLVAASLLLIVGMGAAVVSTESFKFWWGLSVIPLFSRLDKDGVLDNKTRLALHGLVIENPGLHYSAILREFGLSNGAAAYHLDVLERENFIRSVRDGRLKRFFSTDTRISKEHGMTPEEIRESILDLVERKPGISQKEVVYELGTGRDSTGYFLRDLVKAGLLEDSRKGKYTVYRRVRKGRR